VSRVLPAPLSQPLRDRRRQPAVALGRAATVLVLFACSALALIPLVWLVAAAFKSPSDLFSYTFFSPRPSVRNFADLATRVPEFGRYAVNSLFISSTIVCVQLFFSSLAGFALAKYDFKGKALVIVLMLATMMIPGQVTMAPLYELLCRLRLVDTYVGLIVPGAVSVFGIFLFRQSMLQIPNDLLDAARIDGCSEFRTYLDVVMPVSKPMIGAFCLIAFMGSWNSFLWPQIILHNANRFTLPIGLNQMVGMYQQSYGMLMAGTLLSILPVILLFLLLQKEFVAGLTAGAVKG
jgi:ABC-type glycerol-3-phosphate transport system permease component